MKHVNGQNGGEKTATLSVSPAPSVVSVQSVVSVSPAPPVKKS